MGVRDPDQTYEPADQSAQFMADQILKKVRTAGLAQVLSYDAATRRATVQPGLHMLLDDYSSMPRAPISDVPVLMPGTAEWTVCLPVAAGDWVLLIGCARDIDGWKQNPAVAAPASDRIMAEQDCVAIAGFPAGDVTPASSSGIALQSRNGATAVIIEDGHIQLDADQVTINYQGGSQSWP